MVCVYIDGVWDLGPHIAHINFMRQVRRAAARECPSGVTLIVGVISDADAASYKRVPIVHEIHRAQSVAAIRYVDKVVPNAPLIVTNDFLRQYNIDLVYHGNDSRQTEFFQACIDKGIMRYVPYDVNNTGVTTSMLIERAATEFNKAFSHINDITLVDATLGVRDQPFSN